MNHRERIILFHKLFTYDPATGVLTRSTTTSNRAKSGMPVGYKGTRGYLRVNLNHKLYYVHRVIWEMVHGQIPEGMVIDHKNGVRSDNRLSNLRLIPFSENSKNKRLPSSHKFGHFGVRRLTNGKWNARIKSNGVSHHIGNFMTKREAVAARKAKEVELNFYEAHGT